MLESTKSRKEISQKTSSDVNCDISARCKKLESSRRASMDIINRLFTPIDTTNRFINLALHHIDEGSQSRRFLLESKLGVRTMETLLKELDAYAKKMEAEISEIKKSSGECSDFSRRQGRTDTKIPL